MWLVWPVFLTSAVLFPLLRIFRITQGWSERWWVSVWEAGRDPREGHQFDAATGNGIWGQFLNEVYIYIIYTYKLMVLKSRRT